MSFAPRQVVLPIRAPLPEQAERALEQTEVLVSLLDADEVLPDGVGEAAVDEGHLLPL